MKRVFYCHVPKCAGSSILKVLKTDVFPDPKERFHINLPASKRVHEMTGLGIMQVREMKLAYSLAKPANNFGSGHVCCPESIVSHFCKNWDFVTILREPVDRWISEYIYNTYKKDDWNKNEKTLDEYLQSKTAIISGTTLLRYFSSLTEISYKKNSSYIREAVRNLNNFRLVGTIEKIDQWIEEFESIYELKLRISSENRSPRSELFEEIYQNGNLMKRIRNICQSDIKLYEKLF